MLSPRLDIHLIAAAIIIILVKSEKHRAEHRSGRDSRWVWNIRKGLACFLIRGFHSDLNMRAMIRQCPQPGVCFPTSVLLLIPFIFPRWHSPRHLRYGPYTIQFLSTRVILTIKLKIKSAQSFSHVQLFAGPWTVARQALLLVEFSRQEYWSGCYFLLQPGTELTSLVSPALAGRFFSTSTTW